MSFQASLDKEPDLGLDEMKNYLEGILNDVEGFLPRVEPDFDENTRYDVFVQTEDYNVFLTDEGLQFHGINQGTVKVDWTPESEEVWEYLESRYIDNPDEDQGLEDYLEWR